MNWDDARVVLAFARGGNASAAARALGVSHTTVLRRLQALEADLEQRLVDKTPEGPRLTPAGRELARLAEEMEATGRKLPGGALRLQERQHRCAGGGGIGRRRHRDDALLPRRRRAPPPPDRGAARRLSVGDLAGRPPRPAGHARAAALFDLLADLFRAHARALRGT